MNKDLKFREYIKLHTKGDYKLLESYKGSKTKLKMQHTVSYCNRIYETTPANFKKGHRCPYCNRGTRGNAGELFKRKVTNKYGEEFWENILLVSKYINRNTSITLEYLKCKHTLSILPSYLLQLKDVKRYLKCPICKKQEQEKDIKDKKIIKAQNWETHLYQTREQKFDKRKNILCGIKYCVYPKLNNNRYTCYCKKHHCYFTYRTF